MKMKPPAVVITRYLPGATPPLYPGFEAVGEVVKAGDGVQGFSEGAAVAVTGKLGAPCVRLVRRESLGQSAFTTRCRNPQDLVASLSTWWCPPRK